MRVDKIEYNIEFGELEIESLSGKLNIGANYPLSAKWLEDARIQKEPEKNATQKANAPSPRSRSVCPFVFDSFTPVRLYHI
ncbi:spore germination protein GerPC [Bacillus glycinifermentans]|uniref:spore germination protein GerPC n=1 Tax=Bacillus glycinifermentans TaxID=1664069 RepID=UPI00069F95BE|nr:spore germination protein GerPC [Bacillus glycinifermentans]